MNLNEREEDLHTIRDKSRLHARGVSVYERVRKEVLQQLNKLPTSLSQYIYECECECVFIG